MRSDEVEIINIPPTSEREKQWKEFSDTLSKHLREYTVPQYGDVGEDEITNYTVEQCVEHIKRYAKRYGSQSREGQQELDFLKIAHYAQCAWEKYGKIKQEGTEEILMASYEARDDLECIYEGKTDDGKTIYVYKGAVA